LGPIRVGTGDGAARGFVFPDTFFRRRELKVRSIATLPNPVGVNERPERGACREGRKKADDPLPDALTEELCGCSSRGAQVVGAAAFPDPAESFPDELI